jgi:hypothetical protein
MRTFLTAVKTQEGEWKVLHTPDVDIDTQMQTYKTLKLNGGKQITKRRGEDIETQLQEIVILDSRRPFAQRKWK